MNKMRILPPTYLLISIFLVVLAHLVVPVTIVFAAPWNLIGIAPLILGIVVNVNADNLFRTAGTTVKPFNESSVLVRNGLYGITRNPMYLGFVLILLGPAVLLGSLTPFLVVILFAILMDRGFISFEERMLEEKFGKEWRDYKGEVRRWL